MGSSGRGRALTRVNRGGVLGWGGWVRRLSEKRESEMEGIKAGYYGHFVRVVSVAAEYGYSCWSNYTTAHDLSRGSSVGFATNELLLRT